MFSGINVENLNNLIIKNNLYNDSIVKSKNNLIRIINELNYSYEGKSLNYLFSSVLFESDNIKNIPKVIESYSDILYKVIKNYQIQDLSVKSQTNNSFNSLNREVEKK